MIFGGGKSKRSLINAHFPRKLHFPENPLERMMTRLPEDVRACAVNLNARSRERATVQTALIKQDGWIAPQDY